MVGAEAGPIPTPPKLPSSNLLILVFSRLLVIPQILHMGALLLFSTSFLFYAVVSGSLFSELILPNFTASHFKFIDNGGDFLTSRNGTFRASIFNPGRQNQAFYLCVIHEASNVIIWSANRDAPISKSGQMRLTAKGIKIVDERGNLKWSTPQLGSSVSALLLTEMGNLALLDQSNNSLWESFDHPKDTIVTGQRFPASAKLSSPVSSANLSTGDYRLAISVSDLILQWHGQTYWKLSMHAKAYKNSNHVVDYMVMNGTGLFLFGQNGSEVVIQMTLPPHDFRFAQLGASGQFMISSFSGSSTEQDFVGPTNGCQIPFVCGRIGLCSDTASSRPTCSCPPGFHFGRGSPNPSGCVPSDGSSLPMACTSANNDRQSNSSLFSYARLDYGIDYFSTDFSKPVKNEVNLSVCQDFCTADCSCLGFFYDNSSRSCYALENELGSFMVNNEGDDDLLGYIKAIVGTAPGIDNSLNNQGQHKLPLIALVLIPLAAFIFFIVASFLLRRRWRLSNSKDIKLGRTYSHSSGDLDAYYIPGLPKRFDYEELELATDNFQTQIGSGGFGSVYKGVLPDKSVVAVKKITNFGVQGKKDFCTEIAVIGNIHHVNLVKLKGFCAQGGRRLLVYEYMNRGSLDKTLFYSGPVLEWQERLEIALGTARGLAYLHSGCDNKIIHCDVKPENILLHDHFQVKISDFGLSKLLSPEQSSLFTTMRGTRGYLAPEWLTNAAISEKTDVYSFGMVLLEIVSGRKNCFIPSRSHSMDHSASGQSSSSSGSGLVYFPLFALEMHGQGRYLELVDPRLEGRVTGEEVETLVRIALCCVHEEPALRPNMVSVVGMLEGGIPLGHPRLESLNFLRFYGRRFTEASTLGRDTEQNNLILYRQANESASVSPIGSHGSLSYISSQTISGPR